MSLKYFSIGFSLAIVLSGGWIYYVDAPHCVIPFYGDANCKTKKTGDYEVIINKLTGDITQFEIEITNTTSNYQEANENFEKSLATFNEILVRHIGRSKEEQNEILSDINQINSAFTNMRDLICGNNFGNRVAGCGL